VNHAYAPAVTAATGAAPAAKDKDCGENKPLTPFTLAPCGDAAAPAAPGGPSAPAVPGAAPRPPTPQTAPADQAGGRH
jgi:hypothetical protein